MHIDFRKMQLKTVTNERKNLPSDSLPEIVMAGRSNSGKSTLINALAGQKNLARTSSTPGKTRLMIFFEIPDVLRIADLPGYGYAKASQSAIVALSKVAEQYFEAGRPIHLVLLLMDIRVKPSAHDAQMIAYLQQKNIPFMPVFTKADKLSRAQRGRRMVELEAYMTQTGYTGRLVSLSAQNATEIEQLRQLITETVFPDSQEHTL